MLHALLYALTPVAVGAVIGLLPPVRRALEAARWLAVGVALAVVVLVLLPEAIEASGPWVLPVALVGLVGPFGLEAATHRLFGAARAGNGLFWLALALHQVVDGAGIAWSVRADAGPEGVALAVGAHTVPLVATSLAAAARRRPVAAGGLLLGATALGVVLVTAVPLEVLERWEGWIVALVAGLLLHVLGHSHDEHDHRDGEHHRADGRS